MLWKEGMDMIAMQYKIILPDDFDMDVIRKRVAINGHKTDGFEHLLFKAYLISEKSDTGKKNEYSPLYLWRDTKGMNTFIFDGYYNNILQSFGWQNINISIPIAYKLEKDFNLSRYMIEIEHKISTTQKMKQLKYIYSNINSLGKLLTYNPEKWICTEYHFLKDLPQDIIDGNIYSILHLSE